MWITSMGNQGGGGGGGGVSQNAGVLVYINIVESYTDITM